MLIWSRRETGRIFGGSASATMHNSSEEHGAGFALAL